MKGILSYLAVGCTVLLAAVSNAGAANITVSFTNNAPGLGTYLTPAWVGFHDGDFDIFSPGAAAGTALERLAEDGNNGPLSTAFAGFGVDGTVGTQPLAPGAMFSSTFAVAEDGSNNYFSFASMVLPTSDFFIGNANPFSTSIAGLLDGTFNSISVNVIGVYDAGTEINDFNTSAGNPLFPGSLGLPPGQTGPNEGADENGVVTSITSAAFAGFGNSGGVDLSGFGFSDYSSIATFTLTLEPTVAPVPIPAALPLLLTALGGLGFMRKRVTA